MPRNIRTGKDAEPLPINTVRQSSKEQVTSEFLHKLFNHANADKVHRTLGVTQGFKQPTEPLPGCYCNACAKANSRRKGLSRKINACTAINADKLNMANTANMVNSTVNMGDFNYAESTQPKTSNGRYHGLNV